MRRLVAISLGLALAAFAAPPALAFEHDMTVNELLGSAGGDKNVRFVELRDPFDEPSPARATGFAPTSPMGRSSTRSS
jgi:hypothetical protein